MENTEYKANVTGFELSVVTPQVIVESNVDNLVNFIEERMKDYSPEKYSGDADAAKKDRTELNKGADQVKSVRQSIEKLNPYGDVIARLKAAENLIKSGSDSLGAIVKARESEEKEAKRKLVEIEWASKKFDMFPLCKMFNLKWLNKTYKLTDISNEMDVAIKRTYSDLKTIEAVGEDADVLKAYYLECLNLSETMNYGEQLKRNRKIAAKEKLERENREHDEVIAEQKKELAEEQRDFVKKSAVAVLAAEAMELEEVPVKVGEYVINLYLTDSQLLGVKQFLNQQGIEFSCKEIVF